MGAQQNRHKGADVFRIYGGFHGANTFFQSRSRWAEVMSWAPRAFRCCRVMFTRSRRPRRRQDTAELIPMPGAADCVRVRRDAPQNLCPHRAWRTNSTQDFVDALA